MCVSWCVSRVDRVTSPNPDDGDDLVRQKQTFQCGQGCKGLPMAALLTKRTIPVRLQSLSQELGMQVGIVLDSRKSLLV